MNLNTLTAYVIVILAMITVSNGVCWIIDRIKEAAYRRRQAKLRCFSGFAVNDAAGVELHFAFLCDNADEAMAEMNGRLGEGWKIQRITGDTNTDEAKRFREILEQNGIKPQWD